MPPLELLAPGHPDLSPWHLSVDGMSPQGPNLSHWPGNRTPPAFRADLSTGICLAFSRAPAAAQEAFLDGATQVLNDHYDTDGFLSLLAVLRPEVALARQERCLMAAATGDYQTFQTPDAFAIDRIIGGLAAPGSPFAASFAGLQGPERDRARYAWLLDRAEQVLDEPAAFEPLYRNELAAVEEELAAARTGAIQRRHHPVADLTVITSTGPAHRLVLNTVAGTYRVLHVMTGPEGPCYRYHDRTESWFEVVSFTPPARRDLRPLGARLESLEQEEGGARWCADAPDEPVPELYRGMPEPQEYGTLTRTLTPSRLAPETIEGLFVEYFSGA